MSREDAINMLYGIRADNLNLDDVYTKDKYDALTMAIKALEQTRWIPVNEKIPIIETDVLLTSWNGKAEYVGWIDAFGKWHADEEEVIDGYEPLAWMPLPEPYKGK